MRRFARTLFCLGASVCSLGIATPQMAKAYEVDCAILLCLSGGLARFRALCARPRGIHPADHPLADRTTSPDLALPHGSFL